MSVPRPGQAREFERELSFCSVLHWGRGYTTEAARLALDYAFAPLALRDIVAVTPPANHPRAVMNRLGMRRDPAADCDRPALSEGHPLRRHLVYRLGSHRAATLTGRGSVDFKGNSAQEFAR